MPHNLDLDAIDPTGDIRDIAEKAGGLDRRTMLQRSAVGAGATTVAFSTLLSPAQAAIRKGRPSRANDVAILNYALTLEYLEAAFYAQALQGITFRDPNTRYFAEVAGAHEAEHVTAIQGVLGSAAVDAPAVNFGSAVTDEGAFLNTAVAVEDLGVSAYAGQGGNIQQLAVLRTAVAIHSVEARHAAWARCLRDGIAPQGLPLDTTNPAPAPNAYDEDRTEQQTLKVVAATGFLA